MGHGFFFWDRIYALNKKRASFLIWVSPALVIYLAMLVLPMAVLGAYSFYYKVPRQYKIIKVFTIDAYWRFFSDPYYLKVLASTIYYGILVVAICLLLGYPVAYLLSKSGRWRSFLYILILTPFFVSQVIKTFGWMILLSTDGPINRLFMASGLTGSHIPMLYNKTGVIIGMVHVLLPFMIIVLDSVLIQIDGSLLDMARSLGAKESRVFWEVTFPLSMPGLVGGSLLVFTLAVSIFTTPALMGAGRVQMMSTLIYTRAMTLIDWPIAAVASWVLLITTFAVVLVYLRLIGNYKWRAQ